MAAPLPWGCFVEAAALLILGLPGCVAAPFQTLVACVGRSVVVVVLRMRLLAGLLDPMGWLCWRLLAALTAADQL
eukprot:1160314-Pelagomonas_calceolata.AAC.2